MSSTHQNQSCQFPNLNVEALRWLGIVTEIFIVKCDEILGWGVFINKEDRNRKRWMNSLLRCFLRTLLLALFFFDCTSCYCGPWACNFHCQITVRFWDFSPQDQWSWSHLWNASLMSPVIFFSFSNNDIRKLDQRVENKKRESSNWIPPSRRLCWKQEPKGVITYTPKSDMTIHLGVVAGPGGGVGGCLTVWLLTVSLGWLVRISHCVSVSLP